MRYRWLPASVWTAAILLGSLVPSRQIPQIRLAEADKLAHLVMYAVLACLVMHALRWPHPSLGALIALACGAFGGLVELAQFAVPGRTASAMDAAANVAGAAAASVAWALVRARRPRAPGAAP